MLFSQPSNSILTIIVILALGSFGGCCDDTTSLDDRKTETLTYTQLPVAVQDVIQAHLKELHSLTKDVAVCTDSTIRFEVGHGGAGYRPCANLHHFFVNGLHFTLRGNKGDPFILDKGYLYWSDNFSFVNYNFKTTSYFRTNISADMEW